MAKQKRVRCFGHSPLNLGPHYTVSWDDVWLRWVSKPGKTIQRLGPCLCSLTDAMAEIDENTWVLTHAPDLVAKYGREYYQEELNSARDLVRRIKDEGLICVAKSTDDRLPILYTSARVIDRAEAERMLAWWLSVAYGVKRPKFQWKKVVKEDVIWPWSSSAYHPD